MIRRLLITAIVFCSVISHAQVLQKPANAQLVTDAAHLLSPEQATQLERRLEALNDSTSNQIAIVTISSLNGSDIESYSNTLFREWGIGTKKNNNGILILVAAQEHRMRIEVGYGLEGAIPDAMANHIIENDMKPAFKEGDYYTGLNRAITDLGKAAAGEYKVTNEKTNSGPIIGLLVTFLIIIVVMIFLRRGNKGGGGMISRKGSVHIWPFLLGSLLGGGGRGGGWGDGGGFGGGGFGGGGFGGFGGGSSGGGGASGGW